LGALFLLEVVVVGREGGNQEKSGGHVPRLGAGR
jgi:hypothetical protein